MDAPVLQVQHGSVEVTSSIKEEIAEAVQIAPLKPAVFHTAEQSVDDPVQQKMNIPILPVKEDIAEIMHIIPQEPGEPQIVDMPAPLSHEDKVGVLQLIPRERITECTRVQVVDVPVPRFHEDMRHSRSVKKWVKNAGFGFLTFDGGSDDVFIHWKELAVEGLQQGDTVSYDTEYDDRKGIHRARHCIVISSGDTGDTELHDTGYDDR